VPDPPRAPRRSAAHSVARAAWPDRWLLDAFRRLGHPAVHQIRTVTADTAWEALLAAGADTAPILETACAISRCEPADLSAAGPEFGGWLDPRLAERFEVVAYGIKDGALLVATANPLRPNLEQDLAFACGSRVVLRVAPPGDIREALVKTYPPTTEPSRARITWTIAEGARVSLGSMAGTAVETLDDVLADALEEGSSDVHLEPRDQGLAVRFRIDGVLQDIVTLPESSARHLISRLKVMAGLDIADRLRPQDGRASVVFAGSPVELRVSTIPLGRSGEKAVIRILGGMGSAHQFRDLGFRAAECHQLDSLLRATQGIILVTGPTGSGKTTTLYSAISAVASEGNNVVTVEDPIEYKLEGINQVQVHERSGLTFAAALRSILRQDPDIVLVGEIRDAETASIAIKASLTGHVVLSTLHTNDAVSAVTRMVDIGADPVSLASGIRGVVAQRLIRKVCAVCSQPTALDALPPEQQALFSGRPVAGLRVAVGCDACRNTGYRGRTVVAEVLTATPAFQQAVARGAGLLELTEVAKAGGMTTLWESGLEKVIAGVTTVHELVDNVASPTSPGEAVAQEAAEAQADIDRLLVQLATPGAGGTPPPARGTDRGPRVLIVDDSPEDRRVLRGTLERAGFRVIETVDGEAALAYVRRLRPDAVVSEIPLPKLDGIGLLEALAREATPPPVVMYTAEADEALHAWVRDLGAVEVVQKPGDVAAFLRGVLSNRLQ